MFIFSFFFSSFIYSLSIVGGKPTPFLPFFLAFVFCTGNGYMQARGALLLSNYPDVLSTKTRIIVGMSLYLFGSFTNIQSDSILRNLRKPGETGYKIPRGLFLINHTMDFTFTTLLYHLS